MTVLVRIQHAAGRDVALERLLSSLPPAVEVITDELSVRNPDPWRGYKACLRDLPAHVSHVAILQDDTIACRNFAPALERIVASRPDDVVCLYLSGPPARTAVKATYALGRGERYVPLVANDYVPVVATMYPVDLAASFLEWTEQNPKRLRGTTRKSDDAIATRWHRFCKPSVICTVPSLVQHPDDMESTIGKRHYDGRDRGRVARHFIGDDDPLDLDW